jgi:hypothetical protein
MYTVHVYPPDQTPEIKVVSSFRDLKRLIRGESQSVDDALVEYRVIGEAVIAFNEEGQPLNLPQNEAFPIVYPDAPRDPIIVLGDQIPYLLGTVVMMSRRVWDRLAS